MWSKSGALILLAGVLLSAAPAAAQLPPPVIAPPEPHFNPSTPFTLPAQREAPVSPVTPGTSPGSPSSGVFDRGYAGSIIAEPTPRSHAERRRRYARRHHHGVGGAVH